MKVNALNIEEYLCRFHSVTRHFNKINKAFGQSQPTTNIELTEYGIFRQLRLLEND